MIDAEVSRNCQPTPSINVPITSSYNMNTNTLDVFPPLNDDELQPLSLDELPHLASMSSHPKVMNCGKQLQHEHSHIHFREDAVTMATLTYSYSSHDHTQTQTEGRGDEPINHEYKRTYMQNIQPPQTLDTGVSVD